MHEEEDGDLNTPTLKAFTLLHNVAHIVALQGADQLCALGAHEKISQLIYVKGLIREGAWQNQSPDRVDYDTNLC
jgi:hypothetical protein